MADLTGFNPDQAELQIINFNNLVIELATNFFQKGVLVFTDGLRTAWCSPKAVEFSNKHFRLLANIDTNVCTLGKNIAISAIQAFNYIAASNGVSTISIDYLQPGQQKAMNDETWTLPPLEDQRDGVVGMNHQNVKLLVGIFKEAVNNLVNGLNELPLDIAFFDPAGEMKAAYKQEITNMVNTITEEANAVYADIDDALETETNTILLAKENAASTLAA